MWLFETPDGAWRRRALGLLRIVTALLFMQHGLQKIFNFPPSPAPMSYHLASLTGVAGALELFGGFLLLIGLMTRPVAFLLSGEMAVAYFKVHAPMGLFPILNRGELAALFSFVFLYLAFAGSGAFAIDALIARRRPVTEKPIDIREPTPAVHPRREQLEDRRRRAV